MGASPSSQISYPGTHDDSFYIDMKNIWPNGQPSLVDAYDGSTVIIQMADGQVLASPDRNGYFRFTPDASIATEFTINIFNSSEFSLTKTDGNIPVCNYIQNNESLVLTTTYNGNGTEKRFYLSPNRTGNLRVNLFTTPFSKDGFSLYLKSIGTDRAFANADSFRGWNVSDDQRVPINFAIKTLGPVGKKIDTILRNSQDTAVFKANCCMKKYSTNDYEGSTSLRACYGLGYAENAQNCDNYMDSSFCVNNPLHEYCGCTQQSLDAEVLKLPVDAQAYKNILMAQPRCWSVGCAQRAYQNEARRATTPVCNNMFCTQYQSTGGTANIVSNVTAGQTCIGGVINAGATNSNPNDNPNINGSVPNVESSPGSNSGSNSGINSGNNSGSNIGTGMVLPPSNTASSSSSASAAASASGASSFPWWGYLIIVLIVLAIVVAIITSTGKKDSSRPGEPAVIPATTNAA